MQSVSSHTVSPESKGYQVVLTATTFLLMLYECLLSSVASKTTNNYIIHFKNASVTKSYNRNKHKDNINDCRKRSTNNQHDFVSFTFWHDCTEVDWYNAHGDVTPAGESPLTGPLAAISTVHNSVCVSPSPRPEDTHFNMDEISNKTFFLCGPYWKKTSHSPCNF